MCREARTHVAPLGLAPPTVVSVLAGARAVDDAIALGAVVTIGLDAIAALARVLPVVLAGALGAQTIGGTR